MQDLDGPAIYCIGLRFGEDMSHSEAQHSKRVLTELAEQTGGQAYFPKARSVFSYFDDVDYSTENGPQESEISLLLDFSQKFTMTDKILIHCRAGVSRSTALAYAVICQHGQPGQEAEAFAYIRQIRPQLFPNGLVVKMADRILKRKGRLLAAAKTQRWEVPS